MLRLSSTPNTDRIAEEPAAPGTFQTYIDATAGGTNTAKGFIYARFTDQGLKPVAISDEDAFTSLAWDIAFRRYVIRLNSGVSGPGDVTGARTRAKTEFASVNSVPDNLEYRTEEYFTGDNCDFVNDGSGIGAPATALASFWSYSACLAMTHNVYVVSLKEPKQRHVKLEVLAYYNPESQAVCDETGEVPMPSGAGNIRIKWAFLD
jgi:HmuY protein